MDTLFRIETDRVSFRWINAGGDRAATALGDSSGRGWLEITKRRRDSVFSENTWRASVPEAIASDPNETKGPLLYEQTNYRVYAHSKTDTPVEIRHRDPLVHRELGSEEDGTILHGHVNFGSQIGRSLFMVFVGGEPEFDFEVEVFPSKLDYAIDYEQILAEVQGMVTGLALEYLRATFQPGAMSSVGQATQLEWTLLLRYVVEDLEKALLYVARKPARRIEREPTSVPIERIRRVDRSVLSTIRRGSGSGSLIQLDNGIAVKQRIQERRARLVLDTAEHRWLAKQLNAIRYRLAEIRTQEANLPASLRRDRALHELGRLEARLVRLSRLEPFMAAEGDPPASFASLQLLGAPGYREAYQCCLTLSLGLRIEEGPVALSAKDLSLLYEYWCYLVLLRLLAEATGQPIAPKELFSIDRQGLHVLLRKGRRTTIKFGGSADRTIAATYNPEFRGSSVLIAQRPDMVIDLADRNWPTLRLILDAKYRIDASPEYVRTYASPGPPEDALNVLHRYRDAILEHGDGQWIDRRPKRTVVQAAAVFPYRERSPGEFRRSKCWRSLEQLGVGAIPLLPDSTDYLEEWLRSTLWRGGWVLADHAIAHRARERAMDWRIAASEPVLIGVLRGDNPKEHLDWVKERGFYYMPVRRTQRRQFATKWIAIYSPEALREPGAVSHRAAVASIEVVKRKEIATPWAPRRDAEELQVLFHLGPMENLKEPIENREWNGRRQSFATHRWTSRLALERAKELRELLLETEPEWRLYEELAAREVDFHLEAGPVVFRSDEDPSWRVWFVMREGTRVRYARTSGFLMKRPWRRESSYGRIDEILAMVELSAPGPS